MTRFTKMQLVMHFGNPDFCIREYHIPNSLFSSNIIAVLQIVVELQG